MVYNIFCVYVLLRNPKERREKRGKWKWSAIQWSVNNAESYYTSTNFLYIVLTLETSRRERISIKVIPSLVLGHKCESFLKAEKVS
jgi:hypothetical protein